VLQPSADFRFSTVKKTDLADFFPKFGDMSLI
jgi:hypothetical protein